MTIPTYEHLLLPLLEFSADNEEHSIKEFLERLSTYFKLTEEEKNQTLQNGSTVFYNRLGWAQTYLKQAGLIQSTRRGFFRITERGSQILDRKPTKIDVQFLSQFPEFVNFSNRSKKDTVKDERTITNEEISSKEMTPEEMMDAGYAIMQEKLKDELLATVKKSTPRFFEKLVVDLI